MSSAGLTGQPVLILKEGASRTRGSDAQHNNITAAQTIVDVVKSSLGPKGMDKMIIDSFGDVTIINDGATILKEMEIQHPAAKIMMEVARTQDNEVGDGTTSVVVVTGELLTKAQGLIDRNIHPTIILNGYRKAAEKALAIYDDISIPVKQGDVGALKKIAMTSLYSKITSESREYLAGLVVDAVLKVTQRSGGEFKVDLDDVKMEKKAGGSISNTALIQGIIIDKEIVHSSMAKRIEKASIALLDCAIEVEKTEFEAKLNIEAPEQIQAFLDAEEKIIREMIEDIARSGATFVVCQKGIDDLAQYLLAEKGISAVRRVKKSDVERLSKATSGTIVSTTKDLSAKELGYAAFVEERKIADDRMTFFEGCKNAKAMSILVRGGTQGIVDEVERSLHDALSVVKDTIQEPRMVAGGGSAEEEVAKRLRTMAEKISGREQLAVIDFADAMEVIPITLAENAGLDSIDILVEIRAHHEKGQIWAGIEPFTGIIADMKELEVFEPISVRKQIIKSATEASSLILRIDDLIASSKMKSGGSTPKPPGDESYAGD